MISPLFNGKFREIANRTLLCVVASLTMLISCSRNKSDESRLPSTPLTDRTQALVGDHRDSLQYVGFIQKFADNGLFYTDLYFVEDFDYENYFTVEGLADEVVFEDEEVKRTRLELEQASPYFDLTGLRTIDIYDTSNRKLGAGRLSHVEYVEDMIESSFVAVFEVDNPDLSDFAFCVGNADGEFEPTQFSQYQDDTLTTALIEQFALNSKRIWRADHYRLNDHKIYSAISADTTAIIIETDGGAQRTLYTSKSNEAIMDLIVVSKKINEREILLTACGMPETDMTWTSVLMFNGSEYVATKNNRVYLGRE